MRFDYRPGASAIACVLALAPLPIAAQQPEGLQLRLDRKLAPPPRQLEREAVRFLEADRIEGESERGIVASGNVTLRQRGASIRADRVEYTESDQTAIATGNVRLEREGDAVMGPKLTYRLDTETGEMDRPLFEIPRKEGRRSEGRGKAERAMLEGKDQSRLFHAEYTSCPVPRDDWYLRVRELELDTGRNVGTAYNSVVYFLGVPILYSPFLTFPLDNERKSGFLAPTLGTSGQSGFEIAVPYYWNIAPNYDATLTPKLFSKRGLQLGAEGRYLQPSFSGQLDSEYLPHDRIADKDRYLVGVRHVQTLAPQLTLSVAAQKVSDDDYFRDLSTRVAATSQTNLPRDAILAYRDDHWALSARAIAYQTLVDPLAPPVAVPYKMMPQLLAAGESLNWHGVDLQFLGELSNFRHPSLVNGQRVIVNPVVQAPWRRAWGYVTPRLGWSYSRYKVDENTSGVEGGTRSVGTASLDAGLFFDRPWEFRGERFLQTLEPRLFYLYTPFRDQSKLPNFTTAETDFNFTQMFFENRFIGGDRIGDANQLALALTTRFVDASTGLERLKAAIGQVHYFEPHRVTLAGPPVDQQRSDVLGVVSARWSSALSADAAFQYSPSRAQTGKAAIGLRYTPEPGKVFNAAYRYTRDTIRQADISAQWPLFAGLTGVGRINYSLQESKLLEGLAGFEYNKGCWQLRAVAHRFITATQQVTTSFQIQLELTGLSRIGINPLETLRQNIAGYRRSDEIAP